MKLKTFGSLVALLALVSSCKEEDIASKSSRSGTSQEYSGFSSGLMSLRSIDPSSPSPERYLGRGFNLASYRRGNDEGICRPVLDMARARDGRGWNPWLGSEESISPMDVEVDRRSSFTPKAGGLEDISMSYFRDSIEVKLGIKKPFTLNVGYNKVDELNETTHSFETFSYLISHELGLYPDQEQDFSKVLSPRFVRDLKSKSATDLVRIYGTHVITGYYLGAYSRLVVSTLSSSYSTEETMQLAGSISGAGPSFTDARKVSQTRYKVRVDYSQAGSRYIPPMNLIEFTGLDTPARINQVDADAWQNGIDLSGNAFLSLPFNGAGVVSIPDLIEPFYLKLKYICGIWQTITPNKDLVFAFCDPKTYAPIKYEGEHIYVIGNVYGLSDQYVKVYYGNGYTRALTEQLLSGSGADYASWEFDLDYDKGWTFKSTATGKYLCRDLQVRALEDDTQGLRYWLLNPLFVGKNQSPFVWNKMMLKEKKNKL